MRGANPGRRRPVDARREKEFNELYIPPFRDALRRVVRERLMLQYYKTKKFPLKTRLTKKRVNENRERLKKEGLMEARASRSEDVQKSASRKHPDRHVPLPIREFSRLPHASGGSEALQGEISRYQRKAGVKVRLIRIDRLLTNKLTNKQM